MNDFSKELIQFMLKWHITSASMFDSRNNITFNYCCVDGKVRVEEIKDDDIVDEYTILNYKGVR